MGAAELQPAIAQPEGVRRAGDVYMGRKFEVCARDALSVPFPCPFRALSVSFPSPFHSRVPGTQV